MKFFAVKLTKEQEKLGQTLMFLIKLLLFSIPLYLVLFFFNHILFPLQESVSLNVYWILKSLGFQMVRDGFTLTIQGGNPFVFFISEDCTGWKSMLFLTGLMFSVPRIPMKRRFWGLVFGIPILYLGNLLRVILIVLVERGYGLETAKILHDYLWHLGLVSLVLLVWVLWLYWNGKISKR